MESWLKDYYQYKNMLKSAKRMLNDNIKRGVGLGNINQIYALLRQIKECNEACRQLKHFANKEYLKAHPKMITKLELKMSYGELLDLIYSYSIIGRNIPRDQEIVLEFDNPNFTLR